MLSVVQKCVTVAADAGMISEANQRAFEAADLSFTGHEDPTRPYVGEWRRAPCDLHPQWALFIQSLHAEPASKQGC